LARLKSTPGDNTEVKGGEEPFRFSLDKTEGKKPKTATAHITTMAV
jgi:hypothetical protein